MSGRPIAPRPVLQSETTVSIIGTGSDVDAEPEPRARTGSASQISDGQPISNLASAGSVNRKKVTSACQGCQKRRVKCDGQQPCSMCQRTKSECSYTPQLDGRSIKRKYHEVQRDQDLLRQLLDTIRYSRDETLAPLISLIRSGVPIEDIRQSVSQQILDMDSDGREPSPELRILQTDLNSRESPHISDQPRTSQKINALEITRLADTPLHKVPAAPWTTVTDDDDLVSNLLNSWLTWDKGWFNWIDDHLFVRDMQSGSLDAKFCSPFLVNCILAWGCPYSDFKEARSTKGAMSPLMFRFIDEARRLLEFESADGLCITTVQGLLCLHACLAMSGDGRTGYRWVIQAIGMTREMMTSPLATNPGLDTPTSREISQSLDRTCWGVYNFSTYTRCNILKPQLMEVPRRPRPNSFSDPACRFWKPYPHWDTSLPTYREEILSLHCDFAILEADLSRLLFDAEKQVVRAELEQRILAIYHQLLEIVEPTAELLRPRPNLCPLVYNYHVRVQDLVLRIFSPLRGPAKDATPAVTRMAESKCIEAAIEIAHVCKLYVESWGASRLSVALSHPCTFSMSVFLDQTNISQYYEEINDICVTLRGLSRRWPFCMAMLRMIQLEARQKGKELPSHTERLLELFEKDAWEPRRVKRYATRYPTFEANKSSRITGNEVDMGQFLERLEAVDLRD